MVRDVHPVDELGLAGQVDVVGAGGGAGGDERLAVLEVGADGGDHDLGRLRDGSAATPSSELSACSSGRSAATASSFAEPVADRLELGLVATGQRPAQAVGRVLGQVLGGQLTGEAGGAEEDDVELAGGGFSRHAPILAARGRGNRAGPTLRPSRMDTRRPKVGVGGGTASSPLAIGGMVAAGVLGDLGRPRRRRPVRRRRRRADGLAPFASCDALREWYVDHALDEVGPYGWGGPDACRWLGRAPGARRPRRRRSGTDEAVSNGATGTNIQEAGVDEPDVAKTDGRLVVRVRDGRQLVGHRRHRRPSRVSSRTGGCRPRRTPSSLLLVGDRVLLSQRRRADRWRRERLTSGRGDRGSTGRSSTSTSPTRRARGSPDTTHVVGRRSPPRQYGDTVRLVTSTGLPDAATSCSPTADASASAGRASATARSCAPRTIEDWLPGTRPATDRSTTPRHRWSAARHGRRVRPSRPGDGRATPPTVGGHRRRQRRCTPRPTGSTCASTDWRATGRPLPLEAP